MTGRSWQTSHPAHPTPAYEKERQANQCGTRGREEEEAEDDPDTDQGHTQRRLHGTHADTLRADSRHRTHTPHVSLSLRSTPLIAHLRRLVTLPLLLGGNGADREDHGQHEERAHTENGANDRFHCHPPVTAHGFIASPVRLPLIEVLESL